MSCIVPDPEVIDAYYLAEQELVCVYSTSGGRILYTNTCSDNEIRRNVRTWWRVDERGRDAIEQALETRREKCSR